MGSIRVRDERTGTILSFPIRGDTPTPEDLRAIESRLRGSATQRAEDPPRSLLGRIGRQLAPRNIEDLAPLTIGVPATVGGVLGSPLGPPGIAGGAVLGAGAGSLLQEGLADLGRATGVIHPTGILGESVAPRGSGVGGPFGPTQRALGEMAMEAVVPQALSATVGAAKRLALRRLGRSIPDAGRRIAAYAEELGIPLGVENVTQSRISRGIRRVLGRIPLLSREFIDLDRNQAQALGRRQAAILSEIAPVVTTTSELGGEISEEAMRRSKTVGATISAMYDRFLERASRAGIRIPSEATRQASRDLIDSFSENLPRRLIPRGRSAGGAQVLAPIDPSSVMDTSVLAFARQLATIEEMTPRQFKTLQSTLNAIIEEKIDNRAVLRQVSILKAALESDLENIADPEFSRQIRGLNATFAQYMVLLESPIAQRIARATGGLGRVFVQRTQQADLLFEAVWNTKSPQALGELRRLVGKDVFARSLRTQIEDVFERNVMRMQPIASLRLGERAKSQLINVADLRRQLGLTRARSPERAALARALELADGPSIRDLERFVDVAEAVLSQPKVDVSDFMARRIVLGGVRSGVRAVNPLEIFSTPSRGGTTGAAAGGALSSAMGAVMSVMGVIATRRATQLLTRPGVLRTATQLMDPNLGLSQRTQLIARLSRLTGVDFVRDLAAAGEQMMTSVLSPQQAEALQAAPQSRVQIRERASQ